MLIRKLSGAWAGGALGALVAVATLWGLGRAGLTGRFNIGLQADLTPSGLYRQVVWGGIWGLLFLLPFWRGQPVRRGIVFALVPAAALLFWAFPRWGRGYLGLEYGTFTPLLVLLLALLWGLAAAFWYKGTAR